jgi:DNA-binding MarR family transcriptional regulator
VGARRAQPRREPPLTSGPDPIEELGSSLQRLGRLLASRHVAARITTAAGVDVSQQGAALLRVLLRQGKQSVATLAAGAAMDLGAVSRQVKLLEDAGAVRRSRSAEDGRVALLELTAEGRRMATRIRSVGVRHLELALDDWTDDDKAALATLLRRMVDDLVATPVPTKGRRPAPRQA